jgi:glutamyl-tRNA synthetase
LHLGNARTFLVNWAIARQRGWSIMLRIDDLDGPRIKRGADQQAIEMLQWLGLDWDQGPTYQTQRLDTYRAGLEQLAASGLIYPCRCTRTEIQAAAQSAPHQGDHEIRYPGTCRPAIATAGDPALLLSTQTAWRFRAPDVTQSFADQFAGTQSGNVQQDVGDFLVATKHGLPSYQFAVVMDDALQQVNAVVRGDDLLTSTFRQMALYEALQLGPVPHYWHLPLVIGSDGRRLAKRHGDSRLAHYREQGVSAPRILGLMAEWCGIGPRREISLAEFLAEFRVESLPHEPTVFRPEDDAWLLS